MSKYLKKILFTVIVLMAIVSLQSQSISVTNVVGMKPDTLIKNYLAAEGVKLLNGKWNWSTGNISGQQIGHFSNTNTSFPFNAGIVMTTGNISVACGPNSSGSSSSSSGVTSATMDPDLYAIDDRIRTTNVLEFDFHATADTFAFTYIFGSEEYTEFVGTEFNDVFAFFLHGVNPWTGNEATWNVAIIPNSISAQNPNGLPVTINNLNHLPPYNNCYVNNSNGTAVQFDGYTIPLTATSYLLSCHEYHMKMSIANVSDGSYDSGVFLKKGSFYLPTLDIAEHTDMENDTIIKSCNTKNIDLHYSEPARQYLAMSIGVLGTSTAEWGDDFVINKINSDGSSTPVTADNNEITFNQGDTLIRLNLASTPDASFTQGEVKTIKIVLTQFLCDNFIYLDGRSEPLIQRDTLTYFMVDNNLLVMNDTTVRYCAECTHVAANLISGTEPLTYHWVPSTGITNPNARESDAHITNNTTYTVTVTDRWGCLHDTATYNVEITNIPTIDGHYTITPKSGCIPMEVQFISQVTPESSEHEWRITSINGLDTSILERNFNYIFAEPGEYTVSLHTISAPGCEDEITLNNIISVSDYPTSDFSYEPMEPLNGRDIYFTDASIGADITSYQWSFGDGGGSNEKDATHAYHVSTNEIFTISHIVTNKNGCADTSFNTVSIEDKFVLYVPNSFTPNDDDVNDIFLPTTQDIAQYELVIYDRYGGIVFTTTDTAQGWDGINTNGKPCQPGIYSYFIQYVKFSNLQETLIKRGSITLVR